MKKTVPLLKGIKFILVRQRALVYFNIKINKKIFNILTSVLAVQGVCMSREKGK